MADHDRLSPFATNENSFDRVAFLQTVASLSIYKQEALRQFERNLPNGAMILDAGIGTGIDLPALERMVGSRGRVIGVDTNQELLDVAQQLCLQENLTRVSLYDADIHDLPFPDDTFGGVRIDRALQHIVDPQRAIEESYRLLKREVTIEICDPDWELLSISHPDSQLTARIIEYKREQNIQNGHIARATPTLLQAGFNEISTIVIEDTFTSPEQVKAFLYLDILLDDMVRMDVLTQKEADEWLKQFDKQNVGNNVLCSFTTAITV